MPDTSFLTGLYPQEYIQPGNGSLRGGDQYSGSRGSFIGSGRPARSSRPATAAAAAGHDPGVADPAVVDGLAANNEVRLWDAFGVWAR